MRVHFRVPALAMALAVGGAACGGSTTPTPVATPTPPPPVTTLLAQGSQSGLEERTLMIVPFRTDRSGTVRATVDWTFPDSTIYVYISAGTCTIDEVNDGSCEFVAASQTQAPKPRVVAAGLPAGQYALYIGNFEGEEEAVSWQVSLTSTASSAEAAATPPPSAPAVRWR